MDEIDEFWDVRSCQVRPGTTWEEVWCQASANGTEERDLPGILIGGWNVEKCHCRPARGRRETVEYLTGNQEREKIKMKLKNWNRTKARQKEETKEGKQERRSFHEVPGKWVPVCCFPGLWLAGRIKLVPLRLSVVLTLDVIGWKTGANPTRKFLTETRLVYL